MKKIGNAGKIFLLSILLWLIIICIGRCSITTVKTQAKQKPTIENQTLQLNSTYKKTNTVNEIKFVPLPVPMSEDQQRIVFDICIDKGISFTLIMAIIEHESSFDASAISKTQDYGLMQINICNHERLKNDLGITNIMDPEQNVKAGVYLISILAKKYEISKALMAYNMGEVGAAKLWDKGILESEYSKEIINNEGRFSSYIDNQILKGE